MPRRASGFFIKVSHTNAERAFSAINMMMPVSMPTTSWSYQLFRGLNASTKPYLLHAWRITAVDVPQHAHGGSGRNGRSIHRRRLAPPYHRWGPWPAARPSHVALLGVGGGDAPQVVAVIGKLLREFEAETAVHIGGDRRSSGNSRRSWSRLLRKSNQACEY